MSSLLYRDVFWKYVDANTKRELGLDFRDDGEFYMNFNRDFLKVSPPFFVIVFLGFPLLQINRTQHQRATDQLLYISTKTGWCIEHYTNQVCSLDQLLHTSTSIAYTVWKKTRRKKYKMSQIKSHQNLSQGKLPQREERPRKPFFVQVKIPKRIFLSLFSLCGSSL